MKTTYSPKDFGALIGRSTNTLQRWDREGQLRAHRSPVSNRRFYTHDQYLEYMGLKTESQKLVIAYTRVSGVAQKPDLVNQVNALDRYCTDQKFLEFQRVYKTVIGCFLCDTPVARPGTSRRYCDECNLLLRRLSNRRVDHEQRNGIRHRFVDLLTEAEKARINLEAMASLG